MPAFGLIMVSAILALPPVLIAGTLMAGFGAGLFAHGTLTAAMRAAPRDQIGLSLGAWGAVQTTAAGLAIVLGGVIRDIVMAGHSQGSGAAAAYLPVFSLEAALLLLTVMVALPLRRKGPAVADGPEDALAGTKA